MITIHTPTASESHITVVLPVYNGALTIHKALESLSRQTWRQWDAIVIDDGSTDDTATIVRRYAAIDPRVHLEQNFTNRGLPATLNRGWRNANAQLIARMDADDECMPTRFEEQLAFLVQHPEVSVLGTGAILEDENAKTIGKCFRPSTHDQLVSNIYKRTPFFHPSVIIRRGFLADLDGYDEALTSAAEDTDLWLRGYKRYRYHNLRRALINYKVRAKMSFAAAKSSSLVLLRNSFRNGEVHSRSLLAVRPVLAYFLKQLKLLPAHNTARAWHAVPDDELAGDK